MAKSVVQSKNPKAFRRGLDLGPLGPVMEAPIQDMPAPSRLYVPLKQHRGAWCESKVTSGDEVKIGQLLGESADLDAAPVYSPVSGKVLRVGDHPDPWGKMVPTVVIENDGEDQWLEEPVEDPDYLNKKISAMIRTVRRSGVVLADSGLPAHSLLAPPERPKAYIFLVGIPLYRPVETIIISAMDPEPTMGANRRLLVERAAEIGDAVKLLKKVVGAKNSVLVVDEEIDGSYYTPMVNGAVQEVVRLKNRYPVSRQELLTTAIVGKELPWPDGDPRDLGCLVLDMNSLMNLFDAVRLGRPQIDRIVTIRGSGIPTKNLKIRLGTAIEDVIAFAGGKFGESAKVVVGGLMDGAAQYSGLAPVTKETNAIHVLSSGSIVDISEQLCIKCGRCVGVCPMRLLPNVITNFCEFGFFEEAESAELFKCIECGCCAFVCPAKRPLTHYIKHGKAEILAKRAAV